MKNFSIALFALAVAVATAPSALADSYQCYDFTFTGGSGVVATGWVEVDTSTQVSNPGAVMPGGLQGYNVVAGGVSFDGSTVSLSPVSPQATTVGSPSGSFIVDNILYTTGGTGLLLDNPGIIFATAGDTEEINIWGNYNAGTGDDSFYVWTAAGGYVVEDGGTLSITATPEPSTLILLGSGLLGLAFVVFRKAKPAIPVMQQI